MKNTFAIRGAALVLVAAAGLTLSATLQTGNSSGHVGVLGMVAASPRSLAHRVDTITAPNGTDTIPTTTAPTTTEGLPPGAVNPKLSISKPSTVKRATKPPAYRLKAGKPVTWWYSVNDPTGFFSYGITVFVGTAGKREAAGSDVQFVYPSYHRTSVRKSWTWLKPTRGSYQVCAISIDMGPVRGGRAYTCQNITVVR